MPTARCFAKRTQFGISLIIGMKLMTVFLAEAVDDGLAWPAGMPTPRGFAERTQFAIYRLVGMKLMTCVSAEVLAWVEAVASSDGELEACSAQFSGTNPIGWKAFDPNVL